MNPIPLILANTLSEEINPILGPSGVSIGQSLP